MSNEMDMSALAGENARLKALIENEGYPTGAEYDAACAERDSLRAQLSALRISYDALVSVRTSEKEAAWPPDMECIARLLAQRGFRLSRGTWAARSGERVPTVCIDRPEHPTWGQVWAPWYAEKQHATHAPGEAQAALQLAGDAITKWESYAFDQSLGIGEGK